MFLFGKKNNFENSGLINSSQIELINKLFQDIAGDLHLDEILQKASDELVDSLNLHGCVLFLKSNGENYIYTKTISQSNQSRIALKMLNVNSFLDKLKVSLDQKENLVVDTFLNSKDNLSTELWKYTIGVIDKNLTTIIQKATFTGTVLSVPVTYKEKVIGVLMFTKRSSADNFDKELPIIRIYASQVGIAITNASLFDQQAKQLNIITARNEDLQSLYNLTSKISQSLDPKTVAQTAVNSLPQDKFILGAVLNNYIAKEQKAELAAFTESAISYDAVKLLGDAKKYATYFATPGAEFNIVVKTIKQGIPNYSNDLGELLKPSIPDAIADVLKRVVPVKSLASFPLKVRNNVIGSITYFVKEKKMEELTDTEKQLLETYTFHIAIALENADLYEQQQIIQANLEKALNEVQALRQHEQDMIDIMGHELRTPISIVRNALGMLELELKNTGEVKKDNLSKFLDISMESARREVRLVETLLSSAKADSRGFQLIFEKVDFLDVINDSLEFFNREAAKKGLQIKYEKPAEEYSVYCDRTRIQEVMDNFLSNSIKYTDKGYIKISVRKDNDYAYIEVNDTGIGMSEKDLKSIGQKFYRVDQYMDSQEKGTEKPNIIRPGGTGLGLYVTFSLIKVMDGKIDVKSQLGVGSTFTFGMPLFKGQETKQEQRKP